MNLNASTAGLRVLHHILGMDISEAGDAIAQAQPFLTYDEDKKVLAFVRSHLSKHGKLPHSDTILDKCAVFMPPTQESYGFDFDQLENRFIEDGMRDASDAASELIAEGHAKTALTGMLGSLLPLTQNHGGLSLFDFRATEESALARYKEHLAGLAPPVKEIGYPTLDAQGGMEDGDMMAIIGRPASGKTWLMLMTALTYWGRYAEPVLFVTQEMSALQIERRALPLMCSVDPTPLYKGVPLQYEVHGMTHDQYLEKLEKMAKAVKSADAPFLIYDSKMAGTVADIESIAAIHGIKNIWIDGAYMLRHPNPMLGRYARVPENLDLLKYFCQRTGAKVISSWQFKRNAGKQDAEGETPDLDDIGYSHAIAEYMGIILGLLENPKSMNQLDKKHINVMKGRNGEVGGFDISWNFQTMNFSEITAEASEADLTYL